MFEPSIPAGTKTCSFQMLLSLSSFLFRARKKQNDLKKLTKTHTHTAHTHTQKHSSHTTHSVLPCNKIVSVVSAGISIVIGASERAPHSLFSFLPILKILIGIKIVIITQDDRFQKVRYQGGCLVSCRLVRLTGHVF